jgi:hypothetical protein
MWQAIMVISKKAFSYRKKQNYLPHVPQVKGGDDMQIIRSPCDRRAI